MGYVNREPDEQVEPVDDRMYYYHAHVVVKCKLFALTLSRSMITWFISNPHGSIDSWTDISKLSSPISLQERGNPQP